MHSAVHSRCAVKRTPFFGGLAPYCPHPPYNPVLFPSGHMCNPPLILLPFTHCKHAKPSMPVTCGVSCVVDPRVSDQCGLVGQVLDQPMLMHLLPLHKHKQSRYDPSFSPYEYHVCHKK